MFWWTRRLFIMWVVDYVCQSKQKQKHTTNYYINFICVCILTRRRKYIRVCNYLLIVVLLFGLGNCINTVDSPALTFVSLHFCPTSYTTFCCQQHSHTHSSHPNPNYTSHVWRKIWRKSCSWQKLAISIGQGWSRIPCWSCPPSPSQG